MWWIGAALTLLLGVAWALGLSAVVSRGEKAVYAPSVAPWYLFHAGLGMLGLWMIIRAVG